MDCHSKASRYLEVWETEFFVRSLLLIQKGLRLAMLFIHFYPNDLLLMFTLCFSLIKIIDGITHFVHPLSQGQV